MATAWWKRLTSAARRVAQCPRVELSLRARSYVTGTLEFVNGRRQVAMCAGFHGWAAPKVNNALSQRATRNMNTKNGIRVPDSGNPMEPKMRYASPSIRGVH